LRKTRPALFLPLPLPSTLNLEAFLYSLGDDAEMFGLSSLNHIDIPESTPSRT